MRFGVHVAPQHCDIQQLKKTWLMAEALGFEWVSTFDHNVAATGELDGDCFEGLTTHAALATMTSRVRVGCLYYCSAFRNPGVLAKATMTIDHLSGGRAEVGLSAGWWQNEHEAFGFDFEPPDRRLGRLAETVEILRALFTGERLDYEGEFFTLHGAYCRPRPIQGRPRIWIAASGEEGACGQAGLELAGRMGDGWNLVFPSPEGLAAKLAVVLDSAPDPERLAIGVTLGLIDGRPNVGEALVRRFGRTADVMRHGTIAGTSAAMVNRLGEYADLGVDWAVVSLRAPFELDLLERFSAEVMPEFDSGGSTG